MSNLVAITVDNPDELLRDGQYDAGAIVRVQSSPTEAGAYADLSGTGADPTIPILAGVRLYQADDPAGAATTWYRVRYENATATVVSDWSDPFQVGAGDALATLAQAKVRLELSPTDSKDDALLTELLSQVSDEIRQYVGRRLTADDAAEYLFDTQLGHEIAVPMGIRSVTAVEVAATDQPDDGSGAYLAVPLTDVLLRPRPQDRRPGWPATLIVLLASPIDTRIPLREAANGAKVSGDFGFADVLPTVRRIALAAVASEYLDRKRSGSAGRDGIDLPRLLEPADLAALARLRATTGVG